MTQGEREREGKEGGEREKGGGGGGGSGEERWRDEEIDLLERQVNMTHVILREEGREGGEKWAGGRVEMEKKDEEIDSELNLERGMCTIPQQSVLSRNYRVLVRAGSRANAEMHALFASHRGSFRRLLKVKVQLRPERERINKLLSFLVV